MTRLTNNIREAMARKLVAYRYADEAKEFVQLNRTLADRAYAHLYPEELVAAMAAVQKYRPNAFPKESTFHVNAGGYNVYLGESLRSRWVRIEQAKHEGYATIGRYGCDHIITDEALAEEIKNFVARCRQFDATCEAAYNEAMGVLNTVTTGKKLAAVWPEAMDVIGDLIPEDNRTLPVVQVAAINAKFKLPPEKKA